MSTLLRHALAALALVAGAHGANAQDWLPVREIALELRAGSPLDVSGLLPNAPITPARRLIANPAGRLAHADRPDEPARLSCASLAWSPASGGFPNRADADRYAKQLAMHGYNLARLHFVDASLMFGRQKDFDFDPDTLDRIHYLLAALKRNGIYWMIDGMSSWRGAYGGHDDRWDPGGNFKLAVHLDDAAFGHWKRFVETFFATVNPHTGVAPIKDEALALVVLMNENGIEFEGVVQDGRGKPPYDPMLAAPFTAWLGKRYASSSALAKAWGRLGWSEKLENGTIALPTDRYADSPRMRDLQAFFAEVETVSAARMGKVLRDIGFRGLISTYNNWPTVQTALSRRELEAVTMNTYHDWASGYAPGSRLLQTSSIGDRANAMRMVAASRWLGRPFVMTEWDHLFWNRFRYEGGLVFPAYAALQGWDALCRHAHGPIVPRYGEPFAHKRAMLPYAIALDPVARAGETLSTFLFRRGDVAVSRLTVPFTVRGEEDLGADMQAREPEEATRFALLGRIGLVDAGKEGSGQEGLGPAITQPRDAARPLAVLEALRKGGRLPKDNATDPAAGIYQSDTGEITLDEKRRQLRLVTAATEALAFSAASLPARLGLLSLAEATTDGLVALVSLDRPASLAKGRRFLLIYATDAQNTGMIFRDREQKIIEDFGRLPVRIRKGALDLRLAREAQRWRLSPVGLDGTVRPVVANGSGEVAFRLSNDAPTGPTTYFLLELDDAP